MSWFSNLFGKKDGATATSTPAAKFEDYKGFRIAPTPMDEGGQYRLSALIEMDTEDGTKTHKLIRADLIRDKQDAEDAGVQKAKQLIDQMGARLFD